jgi:hypothetical protein
MEQGTLKKCKQLFEYQHLLLLRLLSSNLYLNIVHFSTPVLIRQLWQLKNVVFLHWCLICTALLNNIHRAILVITSHINEILSQNARGMF